jgi:hypothetical protein
MLAFLHTAAAHVATFDALVRELDPALRIQHEVRQDLLDLARSAGPAANVVRAAVAEAIHGLAAAGARVVVCTCSTLGGVAETTHVEGCRVLRVDRAAAERAIRSGRRIVVVAALPTALDQTLALLDQVASEAGVLPDVVRAACLEAWPFFERGEQARYIDAVARTIESSARAGDVVLLAQASMAAVTTVIDSTSVLVIASPRLAVEAALLALGRALEVRRDSSSP